MNHMSALELVAGYVLDALAPSENAAFEAHLAGCATCRAEVAYLAVVPEALGSAQPVAPPADLERAIMAGLHAAGAPVHGAPADAPEELGAAEQHAERNGVPSPTPEVGDISPDAVSPDAVSPDAVSPDAVSPDAVSPGAVSPDAVSPGAVSPGAVSPDEAASLAVGLDGGLKGRDLAATGTDAAPPWPAPAGPAPSGDAPHGPAPFGAAPFGAAPSGPAPAEPGPTGTPASTSAPGSPPDTVDPAAPPTPAARQRRRWIPAVAAAAIALFAVGVGVGTLTDDSSGPSDLVAAMSVASAPDAVSMPMAIDGSHADLVVSHEMDAAAVMGSDVPMPAGGGVYQMWQKTPDGDMTPVGTFVPTSSGHVAEPLRGHVSDTEMYILTVEPKPGMAHPTSDPIAEVPM